MKGHEGLPGPPAHPLTLTKPRLLVSLHLDGQAEVRQFHCGPFAFAGQKQVLRLQGDSHQGTVFTPQAVVRGRGQNRGSGSWLDREAQPASQHGYTWARLSPRPICYTRFLSGDKNSHLSHSKGSWLSACTWVSCFLKWEQNL